MARELLGGAELDDSLREVARRIATMFDLSSASIELAWADSDERAPCACRCWWRDRASARS